MPTFFRVRANHGTINSETKKRRRRALLFFAISGAMPKIVPAALQLILLCALPVAPEKYAFTAPRPDFFKSVRNISLIVNKYYIDKF